VLILGIQVSFGLLFETRTLNEQEKNIAEKDYLSIIQKCVDKINAKVDSGAICDAFMGYYINQCQVLDNLLSYCDIKSPDEIVSLNPLLAYEVPRSAQQRCIKQPDRQLETICEDYLNIPGLAEKRFKIFDSTKKHVHIPSAKVYTNIFSPKIFGEVVNNFSYPIESVHIFARIDDVSGNTTTYKHAYTEDNFLKPGQKSGFWLSLDDPVAENNIYSLTSVFQNTTQLLQEKLQLKVNDPNYSSVTGSITNLGNISATNVKVTGIFYDKNHEVVDTGSNYVNLEGGILPGQQVSFSLTPTFNSENSDRIVSYELNVQSSQYSMLPANNS
jgi:hypothetical protein